MLIVLSKDSTVLVNRFLELTCIAPVDPVVAVEQGRLVLV